MSDRPLGRRALLGAASGLVLAAPALAQSKRYTLRYGSDVPESHPVTTRMKEAAAKIAADTGGAVSLGVFPDSQLGSATDMFSQVRNGSIDFYTLVGATLSTLVPSASLGCLGYVFETEQQAWKAMDEDLGAHIRADIDRTNIVAFEKIWEDGFRHVSHNSKPVLGPDDLNGLKIRVPVSPIGISLFRALGASPTSINFGELYTALQTKIVDSQETALVNFQTARLNEVQKYVSFTRHMWDGWWFLANKRKWEAMPQEIREVIARHVNAAAVACRGDMLALNDRIVTDLGKDGVVFTPVKLAPFRDKVASAGFFKDWKTKLGDEGWKILEKYAGNLA